MTKHIFLISIATLSLFAAGCKKKTTTNTTTCDKIWTVLKPSVTASAATVENGYLLMSITGCKTNDVLNVYRSGLTGDFTAVVNYQDFSAASGAGGFAQFVVSDPLKLDSGIVICGMSNGLISAKIGNGTAVVKAGSGTAGKLTISRTGNSITATTETGSTTATSTRNWLSTACNIGFQTGSNINDLTGILSIKILDITVTNTTGTWMTDKFDCSSLK